MVLMEFSNSLIFSGSLVIALSSLFKNRYYKPIKSYKEL
ncbi:hypothetical protein MWE_0713 [Helicobacter pylori XZ274]|nr:hypothetical protein MWE_0713 [Helicobacter pylori XZ274]